MSGGAINGATTGALKIRDCHFVGNAGGWSGGIISGAMMTISNSTFENNIARTNGGAAIRLSGAQATSITKTLFRNNTGVQYGGAVSINAPGTVIRDCVFDSNTLSGNWGGALYHQIGPQTVSRCTFIGNRANSTGGVVDIHGIGHVFENCSFLLTKGNAAQAFYINNATAVSLSHCTFAHNSMTALTVSSAPGAVITNSVFTNNGSNDVSASHAAVTAYSCHVTRGTGTSIVNGVNGNIVGTTANPIDAQLGSMLTSRNGQCGYPLRIGSPAYQTGDVQRIPAGEITDQFGYPRLTKNKTNRGALEIMDVPPILHRALNGAFDALSKLNADRKRLTSWALAMIGVHDVKPASDQEALYSESATLPIDGNETIKTPPIEYTPPTDGNASEECGA